MKNFKICLMAFLFFVEMPGFTCADVGNVLVVEIQNDEKMVFVLHDKPEMTFGTHVLKMSVNGDNTEFEIAEVSQFYFEEKELTSVEFSQIGELTVSRMANDVVVIEGVAKQDEILLCSASGIRYPSHVRVTDNRAEVSLASLPQGTYIINVLNKQTFKINKQ